MSYELYQSTMRRIADLRYASAVLQWDQETYMPSNGAMYRGQQIATLSELSHTMFTDKAFGDQLQRLLDDTSLTPSQKRNVELTLDDHRRQVKPSSFVRKLTETINRSFHKWIEARKQNSFEVFAPELSELVELKLQEADLIGYEHHPYNALLDEFDKGSNVQQLDRIFGEILQPLRALLEKIQSAPQVDDAFLKQHFPKDAQWNFGMQVLKDLYFDFESGRQDISEHPFTTSFSAQDVRVTTRIDENDMANMVWSCIHELGHALYEQGLPADQYGLPLGEAASLTIHESQSRLWENHIGRSYAFCEKYLPVMQQFFPGKLDNIQPKDLYRAINKVSPSFIRTEADEVTYHFHVMIRYELEKALLEKQLTTKDIPSFWNEKYLSYLGVKVKSDKEGCLQDVHWSHGSFGYFPTYSLGSFYAAQFFHAASGGIKEFDTKKVLDWLRLNVHSKGRAYVTENLCKEITGEGLNIQYFLGYMNNKYSDIYLP
jgi:carboxypeptidase Taq